MRRKPHEKLALYHHGFVVIFFEAQWNEWTSLRKSALMLHWWEEIALKLTSAERGTFWIVPGAWPHKGGELRNASLGLAKLLRDKPDKIKPTARRRKSTKQPSARRTPATDERQGAIKI
jgi:hypothetical protein